MQGVYAINFYRNLIPSYSSVSFSVSEQRKQLIKTMTDSVCQQYDAVSNSLKFSPDSVSSFQMMKLLIPHLKNLRKVLYSIAHILFGVMTYLLQLGYEKCHNDYSQHFHWGEPA